MNRAKALDAWAVTRLPLIDFTVARCAGKTALGGPFQVLANKVCPKRYDPDHDFHELENLDRTNRYLLVGSGISGALGAGAIGASLVLGLL